MADVVLCFSSDGAGAAGQVAPRLAARGYRIWSEDQADAGPIADRIAAVRAAIVLWSDGSRASEWVKAEANFARGQGKLIQATLDEVPPPLPFDARTAIPLAGWTGDEMHSAWRRLLAELERIAPVAAPGPAPAAAPEAKGAAAVAPSPPVRRGRSGLAMAGLLFLLLVAAGAFLWMRSGPPYGNETEPEAEAAAPAPTPTPAATAPPPPPASGLPPADLTPEFAPFAEPVPEPLQAAPPPSAPSAQPSPPARPGPRINRRNSENMRLFCERAGRGTPQCRRFQQQLRRQDR